MQKDHSKSVRNCCLGGLLAATALATTPVFAQESGSQPEPVVGATGDTTYGDDIIVTARLRNERLQDVPVAITALTSETLDKYSVTDIADMATFVPSMVVGRQVTGSSASIFLRGVGSSSLSAGFDQSVSFNIDGLPMSRGREILFSQFDLAQIEVLKGPQALFFGRNTTGGLVNITSKNPIDIFEAGFKAGYGFEANEVYAEGFLSGPISNGLLGRIAFRASDSQGALTNTAPATSIDPAPNSGFQRERVADRRGAAETISARATLVYDPGTNFDATLKAGITKYKDNGAGDLYERQCGNGRTIPQPTSGYPDPSADCQIDGRSPHSTIPVEVLDSFRYARDGKPYTDLDTYYGLLNLHYRAGDIDLTSITSYYNFKQEDLNDFNGATRTVAVTQLADFSQFAQEFRVQTDFAGMFNVSAGLFYAKTDFEFNTDVYIIDIAPDVDGDYSSFDRDNGFEGETYSGFVELSVDISPQLELAGGARYSHDKKTSFQQALDANDGLVGLFPIMRIDDKYSEDNVSPQVSLTWKPAPEFSAYAAYKQGFKAGGYNISQTLTAGANAAAGQFSSEGAEGGEVGIKTALFDRSLRFNATAYYYKYTDLQVQFYNAVTT